MKNGILKKLFSFLSELWEVRVGEGELIKPFYKDVYYNPSTHEKVMSLMGIHLIHRFYIWLAYKAFRDKNTILTTLEDYNSMYEKGKQAGQHIMWNAIVESEIQKREKSAKKKKKVNKSLDLI